MAIRREPGDILDVMSATTGDMARETLTQRFLATDCEWIFYADADMIFPPDILDRLLAHNVDMVTGLYFRRDVPVLPIAYGASEHWPLCPLFEYPEKGLIPVGAGGFGCLLVHRRVFDKMREVLRPGEEFITHGPLEWKTGDYSRVGNDLRFYQNVTKCGITPYLDPTIKCGHYCEVLITEKQFKQQGGDFPLREMYRQIFEERLKTGGYKVLTKETLELDVKFHEKELQTLQQEMMQLMQKRNEIQIKVHEHRGALIQLKRMMEALEGKSEDVPVEPIEP